jgi:ABC-type uncharacterized transport system permease subunit
MVIFVIFVISGGIYDILENPPTLIPNNEGGWSAIHPFMGEQTLNESIFSMIMNFMTFGGLLLAYRSTSIRYDKRKANTFLIFGMILLILGVSGNYFIIRLKRGL